MEASEINRALETEIDTHLREDGQLPPFLIFAADWLLVGGIIAGLAVSGALVVLAGGPPTALAHFMYAPIILAAYRFRIGGGLLCGLIGGIVVGPIAAWIVSGPAMFVPEQITEWTVREAWFGTIGALLGAAFNTARQHASSLHYHLHTDVATSLPNLHAAKQAFRSMLAGIRGQRAVEREVLVTALRLANYRSLAASFGHKRAEAVMRELARRLADALPKGTFLSRTSSDTLTIIDTIAADQSAATYAKTLLKNQTNTVHFSDMAVLVDAVAGLRRSPAAEADAEAMFAHADIAASKAAEDGKHYEVFDPAQEEERKRTLHLLGDVEGAIERRQMKLAYQVKLDLHTRRYSGMEALTRWNHPGQGAIEPARFIPWLEQTRLVDRFTHWVLTEAIAQLSTWRGAGYLTSVAVNLSARNLMTDTVLELIDELLAAGNVPHACLELEITETAFMNIRDSRVELLEKLRSKGVRIAVDDFGTGYASLAYLRSLPLDTLKLDRSFISGMPGEPSDRKMVRHIIDMAKDLGLEVIGEGVEDAATLRLLRSLGCDKAQGYFIAKPMTPQRVEVLLAEAARQ